MSCFLELLTAENNEEADVNAPTAEDQLGKDEKQLENSLIEIKDFSNGKEDHKTAGLKFDKKKALFDAGFYEESLIFRSSNYDIRNLHI